MRDIVTTILDVLGLALITTCAALIFWPAAFAVAGVGLILISRGLSR